MSVKHGLLLGASVGLLACAAKLTPIPDNTSVEAMTYQAKCNLCHALPHPKRHTSEEWQHLLVIMEQRMQERKFKKLNKQERDEIITYLNKHAR